MKNLSIITIIFIVFWRPDPLFSKIITGFQQSPDATRSFEYYDSIINTGDSLKNYEIAIKNSKSGLSLAKKLKDPAKEAYYHLRLVKFYYLSNDSKNALLHSRLFSILKENEIASRKNKEMYRLEDAYLEQLSNFANEIDLNKQLIRNLQDENESYYNFHQQAIVALKIGLGAIILIAGILLYNRFYSNKQSTKKISYENKELQRLADLVERQDVELQRNIDEFKNIKQNQQRNIRYARHIQLSLLPDPAKISDELKNTFIFQLSKTTLSGDFHIVFSTTKKTVVAVLDCSGHGADAAYSTVVSYHHILKIFESGITAPSMVLTMMDQKLKYSFEQTDLQPESKNGVKIAVIEITNNTKEIEYAGAGLPLIYVHQNQIHIDEGNHFPVADSLFRDKFYSSSHIYLSNDDMIYLATDGFYHQIGGNSNKKFMRTSMINLLESMHHQTLTEQKFILAKVFIEWKGKEHQTDDTLVLGIRL